MMSGQTANVVLPDDLVREIDDLVIFGRFGEARSASSSVGSLLGPAAAGMESSGSSGIGWWRRPVGGIDPSRR